MDAPAQLSVLSYLKSPRAQLQPALLLAPKFPRDSALARHCSLDCPEIPQGCSSKTTTAFSHSHGGIFYFDFFFSYVRAVGTSLHESGLQRCGVRLSRDRDLVRRFSLCKWWSKPCLFLFLAPTSFFLFLLCPFSRHPQLHSHHQHKKKRSVKLVGGNGVIKHFEMQRSGTTNTRQSRDLPRGGLGL